MASHKWHLESVGCHIKQTNKKNSGQVLFSSDVTAYGEFPHFWHLHGNAVTTSLNILTLVGIFVA